MTDTDYMHQAIEAAQKSQQPVKCGCVLVKNNQILAQAFNSQRADNDPTAHAEIKALREAGSVHGRDSIVGATAYCTCEPCVMCLAALSTARIGKLIFAVPLKHLSSESDRINIGIHEFLKTTPWQFEVVASFLENETQLQLYA